MQAVLSEVKLYPNMHFTHKTEEYVGELGRGVVRKGSNEKA